ncbi:MAG: hypothetical protein HFE83_08290, partial [Lachnospiraceae bacterium]|nr:hypothetical protein [Lachnospiraceae bacterium]
MSEETQKQVFEMSIGIVLHAFVLSLACLLFFREPMVFAGIFAGMVCAVFLLISMAYSTELCVESADEDYARKKMTTHAVLRIFAAAAVVGVLGCFTRINLLTFFLALLGNKTGAYLYPLVHKILNHRAG